MSKLFYDHLISLTEVEIEIKKNSSSKEEREELWMLVDEIINHKVIEKVLDKLPRENHEEFLELFHKAPHDEELIFGYLKTKAGENIESDLKRDLDNLGKDLLREIKSVGK
jgi:hypothetical protein